MAFCTFCGAQVPDDIKFCTGCGKPMPPQVKVQPPLQAQPQVQPQVQPQAQPQVQPQPVTPPPPPAYTAPPLRSPNRSQPMQLRFPRRPSRSPFMLRRLTRTRPYRREASTNQSRPADISALCC